MGKWCGFGCDEDGARRRAAFRCALRSAAPHRQRWFLDDAHHRADQHILVAFGAAASVEPQLPLSFRPMGGSCPCRRRLASIYPTARLHDFCVEARLPRDIAATDPGLLTVAVDLAISIKPPPTSSSASPRGTPAHPPHRSLPNG